MLLSRPRLRSRFRSILPLLALLPALLCGACTSHGAGAGTRSSARIALDDPAAANDVLFRALGLVGTPYRYGGNTPEGGFDCSGLVRYVFSEATGLALPRQSQAMAGLKAPKIRRARLRPGDLVFFGKRSVDHVGIYVGEGRFVHAPNSGGTVRMDHLDGPYWEKHYLYAKRLLR